MLQPTALHHTLCFKPSRRVTAAQQARHLKQLGDAPPITLNLNSVACQALADTLPFLLCGEESAVHAFSSTLMRPSASSEHAVLSAIAEDEARHAQWLGLLAARLPLPFKQLDAMHMQHFFRSMLTRHRGLHFARVAALDLSVCSLLHGITQPSSPLKSEAWVMRLLKNILKDEGRHVRLARGMAARLGVSAEQQRAVDKEVASSLAKLLQPVNSALSTLNNALASKAYAA